ncbi:MAG: imidazole glycerol phosphate synthase subunit HisH [Verrucomicrobiales bacterium]
MRIGLVDYGAGNLQSVRNALRSLGRDSTIVRDPDALENIDVLIFPGVGAFGDSLGRLREQGLVEGLTQWIRARRPFFGICIGYQVLFECSQESPGVSGLGIFSGEVVRLDTPDLKVPHMGWNSVQLADMADPMWAGLATDTYFYFVHSFIPRPANTSLIAGTTNYGGNFASIIRWPGGLAVQFHPEKSQAAGLRLLANFLECSASS